MRFLPLQRTGQADNIARGVQTTVKSPLQVFSTYGGFTSAWPSDALFHAPDAPGVPPSGCVLPANRAVLFSESDALLWLLPSSLLF
jgi:hypothetical protein